MATTHAETIGRILNNLSNEERDLIVANAHLESTRRQKQEFFQLGCDMAENALAPRVAPARRYG